MYKGGKLVPTSLDLYLALEYCDQGGQWLMRQQAHCWGAVTLQSAALGCLGCLRDSALAVTEAC
jgi:hypothetical protein